MTPNILTAALVVPLLFLITVVKSDCEVDPIAASAPLLVQPNGIEIIYPHYGDNFIRFAPRSRADFVCPGGFVLVNDNSTGSPVVQATCISNGVFSINGKEAHWAQIKCSRTAVAVGRWTNRPCAGGQEAEIGFNLGDNRFIRTITVCFDSIKQIAVYTYYKIINSIGAQATGTNRPAFGEDPNFYNIGNQAVNSLYLRAKQRETVNGLLGLSATNTTYIDDGAVYYLARGHMAARSDFFYPAEQFATFRYINAAPQWQSFNMNNWAIVERDTRNYASNNNVTLEVWTGTFGITTLPDSKIRLPVELYIYADGETRGIPLPGIYWKVVYDPTTNRGVVLIGLNNPYEQNVSRYVYCSDVSERLQWLRWNKNNITRGYSYACSLPDFRKVVHYAPDLRPVDLLV